MCMGFVSSVFSHWLTVFVLWTLVTDTLRCLENRFGGIACWQGGTVVFVSFLRNSCVTRFSLGYLLTMPFVSQIDSSVVGRNDSV